MNTVVLAALISHWRRQPLQLITLLLGLAMATGLWTGVQAINAEARASYAAAASDLAGMERTRLRAPGRRVSVAEFVALRRAGWQVDPVIEGRVTLGQERYLVRGRDFVVPGAPGIQVSQTQAQERARVVAHPDTAAVLATRIGVTALDTVPWGEIWADIPEAAALLGRPVAFDRLELRAEQPKVQRPLSEVAPTLVEDRPDGRDTARLTDSFHLNLTAFGLLSFAVGLFIVHGAIGLAFEQRRATLRSLRAMGVSARQLTIALLAELSALALVAGALGSVLGYLIAAALLPDVAATLSGLYGASVGGTLTLAPAWWITGLAIALTGAWGAGLGALWRARRLPILAGAHPRALRMEARRGFLLLALLGGLLLAIALGIGLWGTGLAAGFALLAALLLGASFVLPFGLTGLTQACARLARRPVAQWFWADTTQQLPGLSLALMALMLALATNVGVGTMVSSFRLTFTGWLDQRLAADLYVTARTDAEAETLRAWLSDRADVAAVLPIWDTRTDWRGAPLELSSVVDHPIYRDHWPMLAILPEGWSRLGRGDGVMINEQMARRHGLQPGAWLDLGPAGRARILGIYSDYGNPNAQVLMPAPRLLAAYPETPRLRHGLAVAGGPGGTGGTGGLIADLQDQLDLPRDAIVSPAEIKAFSLGVFERTFTVTAALNVLTLGVAGFAILTSLLTLSAMRLPQLAPVWALGLTRAELARFELLRATALATLTFVLALPLGLMLAWALLAVVNVAAFGWRLPMFLFPGDWAWLLALSVAAALLAAAWPALRLARLSPSSLLRSFASDR